MRIPSNREESLAILAAMADVGACGGELPAAASTAVAAAGHWIFRLGPEGPPRPLPATSPELLAAALPPAALRLEAIRFLTVMAFLGDRLDPDRIERVLAYAAALDIHTDSMEEIAAAAQGHLQEALALMARNNLNSLTGTAWNPEADIAAWLQPYQGEGADPALAARYRALGTLPHDRLGRAFHDHFQRNGYAMPGEPGALNERFTTPTTPATCSPATTPRPTAKSWCPPSPPRCIRSIRSPGTCCRRSSPGISAPSSTTWPDQRTGRWILRRSGTPGRWGKPCPSISLLRAGTSGPGWSSLSLSCRSPGWADPATSP